MTRFNNILQEMFLETIAKETYAYTVQHKRKTINKKDLDVIINKVDCLCFLEGAMDFWRSATDMPISDFSSTYFALAIKCSFVSVN